MYRESLMAFTLFAMLKVSDGTHEPTDIQQSHYEKTIVFESYSYENNGVRL